MMLKVGHEFAHFKILSKLGEGGMGEVYLAEDLKLHRKVALKVLSSDWFDDANQLERFRREARTAAQISNAYVMAIHDLGSAVDPETDAEFNYIVMEYLDGRSLAEYVKEERLDLGRTVRLAEKIAAGLAAAHKLNIVHRDIKPDNILVDDNGDPKILDFGLAKPLEPIQYSGGSDATQSMTDELTKVGKIMGTVSYMSPEQVKGEAVDIRSDIFSFGILMYRLLSGDLPFAGPTQVETMAKILESKFEPISSKVENIHPELERIINKCLHKDPDDRYQDSRDLVVDLRNMRKQFDSGVSDSITVSSTKGKKGSFSPLLRAAAVVVIVVAAGYFLFEYFSGTESPGLSQGLQAGTNSLAILGFENKTGEDELSWLETGLPEILLTDLSQSKDLKVIGRQRIMDCLPSDKKFNHTHAECVEAAKSLGTKRLLSGSYFRLGENKIRIDARLEEVGSGQIIMSEKVVGEDPLLLVDSLTAKISTALGLAATEHDIVYVSSAEAFKQYHLGMELFYNNDFDDAIDKFQQAIAIDSTFALPYMRIGMIKAWRGKNAEIMHYFNKATEYQDKLPVKDRSILDAYIDTWGRRQFSQALTKIETILRNYPDDAEIRTIYALFINAFNHDTTGTLAQLDTVLMTYPNNPFALEQKALLNYSYEDYDEALVYCNRLIKVLPHAINPRIRKAQIYRRMGRRDEAVEINKQLAKDFPDDFRPLNQLIALSLYAHDFEKCREYVEKVKIINSDDPYHLIDYSIDMANLAIWNGQFNESLDYWQMALDEALALNDSGRVLNAYNNFAHLYRGFEEWDKMLDAVYNSYTWAHDFNKISYPMYLVGHDPANDSIARPILDTVLNDFKARVPQSFWKTADALKEIYESVVATDTARHIAILEYMVDSLGQTNSGNISNLGFLLVKHGDYAKGLKRLSRYIDGEHETTDGWLYTNSLYNMAVANHELGNYREAKEQFQELLQYWDKPDRDIPQVVDTRKRLAELTG